MSSRMTGEHVQKMYDIDFILILCPVGFMSLLPISFDSAKNFFFFSSVCRVIINARFP